jgi:catechol 2,3-dioxygenase-like lactoylglutathione lyase family enzyme
MGIGAFSISLAVKDIVASKAFYEKLGFIIAGGDIGQNWLIMRNDDCNIGLFQGMLPKNTLTFNPGWNEKAQKVDPFKDVRAIRFELSAKGIKIIDAGGDENQGPAHILILDPDDNPILIDQHR